MAAIPDELLAATSLVGDIGYCARPDSRRTATRASPRLNITPVGADPIRIIGQLRDLIDS